MGGVESCCGNQKDDVLMVTKMDLSHCGCVEVPNVVFNAERCIETLILASNQIVSLPPQLFHCQELKHLNLTDNCLSSIPPAIGSLMHLVSLKLDKNNLKDLPENLKSCKKLKRLSLSNNQWKQVPSIATQLISLEELYMNDCELSYLPASVGRLTKLRILELRNNNLCNLPLSMTRLSSLNRLDIGDNEFSEFPMCISSLKSLSELLIDNNDIEEITDIKNLTNLEHFDASYNHLSSISDTIGFCTNITLLNLSFNYLEQIPDSVGNIEKLETFHLEMNELNQIPSTIGKLKNLEDLNVCNNRLCNIPISIGLLRKLKNLNVSRNTIEEFPPEIGSCTKLAIINAGYNRLQVLPSELGYLNNLKVLDLVGNFLMYLPITIINLRSIRAIWLSANQNVPLIPFTEDINIASGERFLTNIALPQLGEIVFQNGQSSNDNEVLVNEKSSSWSKKIRFAEDDDILPGKLHRTPTPFPKELRAPNRKQHFRNDEPKRNDNYVNLIDGRICEQEFQPPTTPVAKSGSGLMNFTESCITRIREANIRRSNKDPNPDNDIQKHMFPERAVMIDREESNLDYVPVLDSNSINSNTCKTVSQEEESRLNQFSCISTNGNKLEVALHVSGTNGEDNKIICNSQHQAEDLSFGQKTSDETEMKVQSENLQQSDHVGSHIGEKIYSNVTYVVNDNGNDQNESDIVTEEYVLRKDKNLKSNGGILKDKMGTSVFEAGSQNIPNHLNLRCTNYSDQKYSSADKFNLYNTQFGLISHQEKKIKTESEKLRSKQDMITLTEKMRSKNISPPCYEIAKMYSTKAALFEHNRVEHCK